MIAVAVVFDSPGMVGEFRRALNGLGKYDDIILKTPRNISIISEFSLEDIEHILNAFYKAEEEGDFLGAQDAAILQRFVEKLEVAKDSAGVYM